jgi:hypothetical protein
VMAVSEVELFTAWFAQNSFIYDGFEVNTVSTRLNLNCRLISFFNSAMGRSISR